MRLLNVSGWTTSQSCLLEGLGPSIPSMNSTARLAILPESLGLSQLLVSFHFLVYLARRQYGVVRR